MRGWSRARAPRGSAARVPVVTAWSGARPAGSLTGVQIPVFVSCPTSLNTAQLGSRKLILDELKRFELEPRALGRSDYPTELPLREVAVIARHCAGGVVLGFAQIEVLRGRMKSGTPAEASTPTGMRIPTAWNHLEAGILYGLDIPLLVFREDGVEGGVFDSGVTDVFVHRMPEPPLSKSTRSGLDGVFMKWQADVRGHYYRQR